MPDLSRLVLYFQLSYYTEEIDQSTKTKSTIKDTMTRISACVAISIRFNIFGVNSNICKTKTHFYKFFCIIIRFFLKVGRKAPSL